jgi:hypothetical protein
MKDTVKSIKGCVESDGARVGEEGNKLVMVVGLWTRRGTCEDRHSPNQRSQSALRLQHRTNASRCFPKHSSSSCTTKCRSPVQIRDWSPPTLHSIKTGKITDTLHNIKPGEKTGGVSGTKTNGITTKCDGRRTGTCLTD